MEIEKKITTRNLVWILLLTFCFGFYFVSDSDNPCIFYEPFLFEPSDTVYASHIILINVFECRKGERKELIDYINSNKVAGVFSLDVNNSTFDEFSIVNKLRNYIGFCDDVPVTIKSKPFVERLKMLHIPLSFNQQDIFIRYYQGEIKSFLVLDCNNFREMDYTNKIVIIDEIGSPNDVTFIPPINLLGIKSVHRAELIASILNSLIANQVIQYVPEVWNVVIYVVLILILYVFSIIIISAKSRTILRYVFYKIGQIFLFILLFIGYYILVNLGYVLNLIFFSLILILFGEIIFWVRYCFAPSQSPPLSRCWCSSPTTIKLK